MMFEYAIQILKNEHIKLLAEEPFSKYITKLEQAIELLKKGEEMITENEIIEILKSFSKKDYFNVIKGYEFKVVAKAILDKIKEKENKPNGWTSIGNIQY